MHRAKSELRRRIDEAQQQSTPTIGASLPAAIKHLVPTIPERWEEHVCNECGKAGRYARRPVGRLCYDCQDQLQAMAALASQRRLASGISQRHAKFQTWDDLQGPPEFLRMVGIVRKFCETGDSILALLGNRGTGKTQAASVAIATTIERGKSARIINALALSSDLKRRFGDNERTNAEGDWLRQWTAPHLLAIDEIGELSAGDHVRANITQLLDTRYADTKPTILIGNIDPERFAECIGASIADRANEGGGIVLCNGWQSFRTAAR